jgi:parallel beta-helix repeat protein
MAITYESNINSVDEYCAIKTGTTATITGFLESSYIAHNWMEGSNETFGASIYNCPSFAFISGQIQSTEIHDNYLIFGGIVAGHGLGDGIQLIDGGLSPIHDNYIEQTYNGINISGSSYSEVHHNIIRAYTNNGIVVSGWLASVQGNSISYGATTGLAGIYGLYANDAQITGNTIIEAWNKGIVLDSASRCIVQSNKITNDTNNHCTVGIVETGDSDYNDISGNMIDSTVTTSITRIGTHGKVIGNSGYNPVYAPSGPSVPATTVAFANTFGYACLVRVTGGASVTDVYVNGILMFHQTGAAIERNFIVPAGGTITLTYTSTAPTWTWTGIN